MVYSCHFILKCYDLFSGVILSIRSFRFTYFDSHGFVDGQNT